MRWFVGLAVLAGSVALMPATALADVRFRGESGQERLATLRSDDAGIVERFGISWRASCSRRGLTYTHTTRFLPAYDVLTHDRFVDSGSYRERPDDGIHAILRARVAGNRISESRWRGIFRISVRVFRGSREVDRCYQRTRWRVARQS